MQEKLPGQVKKYTLRHSRMRRWQKVVLALSCVVVFCTTYVLIMPAITMSEDTFCGIEEHVHSVEEGCYEVKLICGYASAEDATSAPTQDVTEVPAAEPTAVPTAVPTAEPAATPIPHEHTEECYETTQTLTCGLEESPVYSHTHTDECYTQVLTCGLEESSLPVHTHSEACYDAENNLICGLEENTIEPHEHTEACYLQELTCGQEEGTFGHEHSEECYTTKQTLICEILEGEVIVQDAEPVQQAEAQSEPTQDAEVPATEEHVHTEECYEYTLICEKEEHQHSLACYSDPTADVESASVWERTIPTLTGNWQDDLIAVAKSQLGYTESTRNYEVQEDGTIKGYTRYGDWYGATYQEWCAMFVSFCLNYAEVPTSEMPQYAQCRYWVADLTDRGQFHSPSDAEFTPEEGDLIFFDWKDDQQDGVADHVGIVEYVEDGRVHTIEGNSAETVRRRDYALDSNVILGYGELPEQEVPEVTKTATLYVDSSYETPVDDGTVITVTGAIPEKADVRAYPVEIETEQEVLWAYDISIYLPDGTVFEPEEGQSVTVNVQTPVTQVETASLEDDPAEDAGDTATDETITDTTDETITADEEETVSGTLYYVTDEGEMIVIPAEQDQNGVTFSADHFSTYALLAASNAGTWRQVRTQLTNAASGDTVKLTADITVSSNTFTLNANKSVTLDLNGHHITVSGAITPFIVQNGSMTIVDSAASSSGKSFSYKVMTSTVSNAAKGSTTENTQTYSVTTNGYIQGGSAAIVKVTGGTFNLESGLLCDGTGRAIEQTGGMVNLKGGYINGFTKTGDINSNNGFGGAVMISGGTLNISGTVLSNNKGTNGGAIYNSGATVNMTGGVISGNTSTRSTTNWNNHSESSTYRCGGGGIYADGASTTNVSGSYITYNTTTDTGYFDGGGGLFLSGTAKLTFSGGYITGNTSAGGGGIRTSFNSETTVTMTGGFLSGNTATNAEGGGANLDRGCTASVTGGYITNNTLQKGEHWGGGGLFCADGATLYLKNALITQNKGDGFGAGVGGCSTGKLYLYVDDGAAIYDNTATGKNYAEGGAKVDGDTSKVQKYPIFLQHGYQDFFCALNSAVIGTMMGDNSSNWEGTADGKVVNLGKGAVASASELMGLTAHPTEAAKSEAESIAKLYINGNYSVTHGAGVMCNGNLVVGTPKDIENPAYLTIKGTKQLLKAEEKQSLEGRTFTFHVTDSEGNVVTSGTSDSNGNITFNDALEFDKAGTYTYYIAEVTEANDTNASIEYDTTRYRLTVTVTRGSGRTLYGDTKVYDHTISNTQLDMSTDGGANWTATTATLQDGVLTLPAPNGATFTNREKEVVNISVKKVWLDDKGTAITDETDLPAIEVILYRDDAEFEHQTLTKENNWSYSWTGLETGHTYDVDEATVPEGYDKTLSTTTLEDGTTLITMTNTRKTIYTLPETGGPGTLPLTAGGLLLMAGCLIMGYIQRHKHKRRYEE